MQAGIITATQETKPDSTVAALTPPYVGLGKKTKSVRMDNESENSSIPGTGEGTSSHAFAASESESQPERSDDTKKGAATTEKSFDALLRVGAAVEARYRGRLTWFKATVTSVAPNGQTVDLQYDDGALETKVPRLRVRAEGEREPLLLCAGDRCEARFEGGRRCFPAVVINAHRDGLHYIVEYDDGDKVIINNCIIFVLERFH